MKKLFLFSLIATSMFASGVSYVWDTDDFAAKYLANLWIITKQTNIEGYRLGATITRAEVVGIALKIKWVSLPNNYYCKNYFSDVKYNEGNNWICRAVELAADNWLISKSNKTFRPQDTITRAEALAIITKAGGISMITDKDLDAYKKMNIGVWPMNLPEKAIFGTDISWVQKLLLTVSKKAPGIYEPYASTTFAALEPLKVANRWDVFGFAKTMKMISGTDISSNNQIYINNHYKFSINYPQNSTISGNEQDTYIRIQNYPADRETMELSQNEYYLEMHLWDNRVCEDEIQSPKEFSINGVKGLRGFWQSGWDAGGIRYALCINNKNRGYYIQVTEKTQNGSFAEEIFNSFNFIN